MAQDLTESSIERQNILNNTYALEEIRKSIGITTINFKGKIVLTKEQVTSFFEVTTRTIDNLLKNHDDEL